MKVDKTNGKTKQIPPPAELKELGVWTPGESTSCPVVGIGASAGGLDAFSQLLRALPSDTGMAFVVVQHLAPAHASILAEILSRATSMPVSEVVPDPSSHATVEANHVYVIPPGQSMTIEKGKLHLFGREEKGQPRVIDQFFTSLAKDQGHLAIGVILSGTASDGTLGLEEIKAAGGITFAQDRSAQYDAMPRSAIDSGCIDYEMSPEHIGKEIATIASHPFVAHDSGSKDNEDNLDKTDLAPILKLLFKATGADLSQYQPSTLHRRIKRRMILVKAKGLSEYEQLLSERPEEVQALYQDVLINVTSFFRDPAVFAALKTEVIERLLQEHTSGEPLRVWVVACSTGEEVYSLAILFTEVSQALGSQVRVQIFATDLSGPNIEKARAGVYSKQRVQDIGLERLQRFFVESEGKYRVVKPIREMCVFAKHDVIADPPFSRMDLVSCRNLLIYLKPELQARVIRSLHYSLNSKGCLVLGNSETVSQNRELFGTIDAKHKLFSKRQSAATRLPLSMSDPRPPRREKTPPDSTPDTNAQNLQNGFGGADVHREAERLLLARFAPPGVLVNQDLEIMQFRGDTEAYLTPSQGRASLNLLKMVREGLVLPIRAAVLRAKKEGGPIRIERVRFKSPRGRQEVTLEIVTVQGRSQSEGGFLVLFESPEAPVDIDSRPVVTEIVPESAEAQIARIEQDLASTREYLQSIIEQEEATNEELQSANEEAQSSNEELQSINEELETTKEEIQSSNEELITVNDELQSRNAEVSLANNDLMNLIGSVDTAIVMVGLDLSIRRFSPMAEKFMNIIPADLGRPITNISMNIEVANLKLLLQEVIAKAAPREIEVRDSHGHWFSLRIRPYVTMENQIEGAVMMLVDVDAMRRARDYAESIVQTVHQPIAILDSNLCVKTANRAFHDLFKAPKLSLEGRPLFEIDGKPWKAPKLRKLLQNVLSSKATFDSFAMHHDFQNIGRKVMLMSGRSLMPPGGDQALILLAIDDVTQRRQDEARLASKERTYRQDLETSVAERTVELGSALKELEGFNYTVAHDLRTPLRGIIFNSSILLEELGQSLTADQAKMLRSQVDHAKSLAALIDDLLEFSRILKVPVRRQAIDVTALVQQVTDESLKFAPSWTCIFEIQAGMKCNADPALFRMIVTNLVENACKFSPNGGVVAIGSSMQNGQTVFFVKDAGIGFDMAYAEKVFEPFERLNGTNEYSGTGIGLATVKRIVERHDGRVWVESEVGKGTVFFFTIASRPSAAVRERSAPLSRTKTRAQML